MVLTRSELERLGSGAVARLGILLGRIRRTAGVLEPFRLKPAQLGLEFTNLCNANCVFCPYQHQVRAHEFMSDTVFAKAVGDYVDLGGGNIELTPIVGDPLIHPDFVARVEHLRAQASIGHIFTITNGILLDRHGCERVLRSGLNAIFISTAGFEESMYRRIYRSPAYERMRRNVLELVTLNNRLGRPVRVTICLRGDRPLSSLLRDPDFRVILDERPRIRSNRAYSDAGGRVRADQLPGTIRLRVIRPRREPCVHTYLGPSVLASGVVIACNCLAGMDGEAVLRLGDIRVESLGSMWRGGRLEALRSSFGGSGLNEVCAACTMYEGLGRLRAPSGAWLGRENRRAFERAARAKEKSCKGHSSPS